MAADLFGDLMAAALAASAAILLMIASRHPLRRAAGSRVVYAAWAIVPLATLAVFLPSPPASVGLFTPEAREVVLAAAPAAGAPADWTPVLAIVWALGAAAGLIVVVLLQHRALRRLETTAAPGPAVVGLIAPRIVLPADFEERYTPEERAVILSHEQVHLSVGDVRVNAAVALFTCLFWFNPLVHVAARLIRTDQELSCDEAVIARHPTARRTYAEALLKTQLSSASMPLGCYWPERSHQALKERLTMLTLKTPGRGRMLAGAALTCALGLGTGYVAWAAAPQQEQIGVEQLELRAIPGSPEEELVVRTPLTPDGRVHVQTTPDGPATLMTIEEHDAWLKARYGRVEVAQLTNSRPPAAAEPDQDHLMIFKAPAPEGAEAAGQTRFVIRRQAEGAAPADADALALAPVAGVVRLECRKTAEGPVSCTRDGEPVDPSLLIGLEEGAPPASGERRMIILKNRREAE